MPKVREVIQLIEQDGGDLFAPGEAIDNTSIRSSLAV